MAISERPGSRVASTECDALIRDAQISTRPVSIYDPALESLAKIPAPNVLNPKLVVIERETYAGMTEELLHQLLTVDPWGWSALTIVQGDSALIIFNPRHSAGRQASDITHELAHIILGHQPATMIMSPDGSLVMRSYDQNQEDEANWLAWAILLPREALLSLKRKRVTVEDIATAFGVTETLVQYRLRITGIESQLRATTAWRGQG